MVSLVLKSFWLITAGPHRGRVHFITTRYYKHIILLYSPREPVHRVYSLVLAVRPSLLLSGGLGGMFPHAFAVDLLLLSTFLRYYKLLEIERINFGLDRY